MKDIWVEGCHRCIRRCDSNESWQLILKRNGKRMLGLCAPPAPYMLTYTAYHRFTLNQNREKDSHLFCFFFVGSFPACNETISVCSTGWYIHFLLKKGYALCCGRHVYCTDEIVSRIWIITFFVGLVILMHLNTDGLALGQVTSMVLPTWVSRN